MEIIEQVANPLKTGANDEEFSDKIEQDIEREKAADAVPSLATGELKLLNTAARILGPKWMIMVLKIPPILLWGRLGEWMNTKYPVSLKNFKYLFLMVGMLILTFFLSSLRATTRDDGHLHRLGAGKVMVSTAARQNLEKWFRLLTLMAVVSVFVGLGAGIYGLTKTIRQWPDPEWGGLAVFPFISIVVPLFAAWWGTLKMASLLVADAVVECRMFIRRSKPGSAEWDREVVPRVLKLMRDTLPVLSNGWGPALATGFLAFWMIAFAYFCDVLEDFGVQDLLSAVVCWCIPLLLAGDVATASTECDSLVAALNAKRAGVLGDDTTALGTVVAQAKETEGDAMLDADTEIDAHIQVLERLLDRCNQMQGLGFVIGEKVLDRRSLRTIFVALVGAMSTIVPVLVALRPAESIGPPPVYIHEDLFQLPSGKIIAISNELRDYQSSKQYCESRNMIIASIHSQDDADVRFKQRHSRFGTCTAFLRSAHCLTSVVCNTTACQALEHLISKPTYLGATESNGAARWAAEGDWEWEDGSAWGFVHTKTQFANIDCSTCAEADGGYHLMADETHLAAVPQEEHWSVDLDGHELGMTHAESENKTGIATYAQWGSYTAAKLDRGWYDWGNGEAELAVACQALDPLTADICNHLSGKLYTDNAVSCYSRLHTEDDAQETEAGRRALRQQVHKAHASTFGGDTLAHALLQEAKAKQAAANATMVAALLPAYEKADDQAKYALAHSIAQYGGPRLPPL
jgi:hypothetical protein